MMSVQRCCRWVMIVLALGLILGCKTPVLPVVPHAPGEDARAAAFQQDWLPRMLADAREKFNVESVAQDFTRLVLDPSRLVLLEPTNVRVYFVAAQGGYHSALGFWYEGTDTSRPPTIVYPNARSPKNVYEYGDAIKQGADPHTSSFFGSTRPDAPVLPGQFIDLGILPAGTQLVFFIDSDSARGKPKGRFTTIPDLNPDKVQHVVTIAYQDSPYLMLGFEDLLGGGDRSFNDVVFTVELSQSSIQALSDAKKQREVEALLAARARWKEIRARIAAGVLAGIAIGTPILLWAARAYLRRRRIRRAFVRAEQSLRDGQPRDALQAIRDVADMAVRGALQDRRLEIEVQASLQLRDAAQLCELFDRSPSPVLKDEAASLMVARTQLEADWKEDLSTLHGPWQESSVQPWDWLALESDLLVKQNKAFDARGLLQRKEFAGGHDAVRLARLAEIETDSGRTQACLARAFELAPGNPSVHESRARLLEKAGKLDEAGRAWREAARLGKDDPFHRDHYAEFLIRQGDYAGALACWKATLAPPTADVLWLKAMFWDRVAVSTGIDWKAHPLPPGPLRPLVDCLLSMPAAAFWHAPAAGTPAQLHPELFARAEVFWLRALQALLEHREETALTLLGTSRSDSRRYFDTLECALRQVLTYRRMQFLDPRLVIVGPDTPPGWSVPLFRQMDALASGASAAATELGELLSSPRAFVEVLRAIGWTRAAEQIAGDSS